MGKRLIHQRRGKGTPVHRVASHRFKDKIRYRSYDALEKEGSIKGKVIDIVHDPARTAPIAEVKFENGEKKFVLAPESIQIDNLFTQGWLPNGFTKQGDGIARFRIHARQLTAPHAAVVHPGRGRHLRAHRRSPARVPHDRRSQGGCHADHPQHQGE